MTEFLDVSARDLSGAVQQFRSYISGTLGFDELAHAEIGVKNGDARIVMHGHDSFQKSERYDRKVGQLCIVEEFPLDSSWEEMIAAAWEKLNRAMPRDERELRHSMTALGGALEHSTTYTSAVGLMLVERIKKVRDDATAALIEYRKPEAA